MKSVSQSDDQEYQWNSSSHFLKKNMCQTAIFWNSMQFIHQDDIDTDDIKTPRRSSSAMVEVAAIRMHHKHQ